MIKRAKRPCAEGWGPGCDSYTGGHTCGSDRDHRGRHRCDCGATKSAAVNEPSPEDDR